MPKNNGYVKYEDTIHSMLKFNTDVDFVRAFRHLKHASDMPIVWEYHLFKEGIRPIWEDKENKSGGKWVLKLVKGVADRYWETLQFSLIRDAWGELGEEICGGVVSMRSGEDVISLWLRDATSGRNLKIK
jgi:translation initiation factor 4E